MRNTLKIVTNIQNNGFRISNINSSFRRISGEKVILWSKNKWTEVNQIGSKEIPSGRFISGITNGIRIIGLCIPLRFAHLSTVRKDRRPWEDHLSFIQNLSFSNEKTIIIGDFNQNIPRKNQPLFITNI